MAVRVESHELIVVEELAESGGHDDIELGRKRLCVERITLGEEEVLVPASELARQLYWDRVEVHAEKCCTRVDCREVRGDTIRNEYEIARNTTGDRQNP